MYCSLIVLFYHFTIVNPFHLLLCKSKWKRENLLQDDPQKNKKGMVLAHSGHKPLLPLVWFHRSNEKKDASRMPNIYMQIRELAASRIAVWQEWKGYQDTGCCVSRGLSTQQQDLHTSCCSIKLFWWLCTLINEKLQWSHHTQAVIHPLVL